MSSDGQLLAAWQAAERRFRVAFDHSAVPTAIVSLQEVDRGTLVEVNRAFGQLLGRAPEALTGHLVQEHLHPDDAARSFDESLATLAAEQTDSVQSERRFLHSGGQVVWGLVTDCAYVDEHGRLVAISQVVDLSERRQFEVKLRHMADHDPLTGLLNRRRLAGELERLLSHVRRYGGQGAVLALDLDGFKFVNDALGHAAGDELVQRVAVAAGRCLGDTDVLARTGGDEFVIVLPTSDEQAACRVAEKLLAAVRVHGTLSHGRREAQITTSVGITTFAQQPEVSVEDVLVEADIAMYEAKGAGKDCLSVYRQDGSRERIAARQEWLTRLRHAADEHLFVLYAQPLVPICSGGLPRFELLLRMAGESGDLIPPGTFLYNAERFGFIERIDLWVMSEAVRLISEHHAAGRGLALSVNMSAKTLGAGDVAGHLARELAERPIPQGSLIVELTETAAITNMETARELARDLRSLGVRVALDDFGAGFATFYYLKHLEFDYVKIDGEFIRHLPRNKADQLVVRSVVDIARGLGSDTIAEFVQDEETLTMLRGLGVGYGQGYHVGRPGPLANVLPALPRPPASARPAIVTA